MSRSSLANVKNLLLRSLEYDDAALIWPLLEHTVLAPRQPIEEIGEAVRHVYFIESGIVSVVATSPRRSGVEIGSIGFEGMTGCATLLGPANAAHSAHALTPGSAFKIAIGDFERCVDLSAGLRRHLMKFSHTFAVQIAATALANAAGTLKSRLARWLLMAQDRLITKNIDVTHEALSLMLAVHRPGITMAIQSLEGRHLIHATRGRIIIKNREGLMAAANGLYGFPETEYRRSFPMRSSAISMDGNGLGADGPGHKIGTGGTKRNAARSQAGPEAAG